MKIMNYQKYITCFCNCELRSMQQQSISDEIPRHFVDNKKFLLVHVVLQKGNSTFATTWILKEFWNLLLDIQNKPKYCKNLTLIKSWHATPYWKIWSWPEIGQMQTKNVVDVLLQLNLINKTVNKVIITVDVFNKT